MGPRGPGAGVAILPWWDHGNRCNTVLALVSGAMSMATGRPAHGACVGTFVDVFAGCGGLSLGLKRAGWRGLFAIEKDAFAFDTLSSNFPAGDGPWSYAWPSAIDCRPWDIRDLLTEHREALHGMAGKVELLAGGPPCQGFSHAGRRRLDDPRNRLFEAYLELVEILKPRVVLVENVRGFASDFQGTGDRAIANFAAVLRESLGGSYDTNSAVIRAGDFGVPQVRPRFFLVGTAKELGATAAVAGFFDDLRANSTRFLEERGLPRRPTSADAISDLEVASNGTFPSPETAGFEAIAYRGPRSAYQEAMRDGHEGCPSDTRLARHRPPIRERFAAIIDAARAEGRLNVTISAETRQAYQLKKLAIRVLDPGRPSPTITSLPDDLLHYAEPRTLTVRENARLQSFPDWFSFKGKYTTGGDLRRNQVPRFTQVANAVPPLLAEQLGIGLMRLLGTDGVEASTRARGGNDQRPPASSRAA